MRILRGDSYCRAKQRPSASSFDLQPIFDILSNISASFRRFRSLQVLSTLEHTLKLIRHRFDLFQTLLHRFEPFRIISHFWLQFRFDPSINLSIWLLLPIGCPSLVNTLLPASILHFPTTFLNSLLDLKPFSTIVMFGQIQRRRPMQPRMLIAS